MKRLTFSIATMAVLGLAAYTMAGAQGPGRGPGSGQGMDGRGGPWAGRGAMMALRGIDLTDQQRDEIRAIHEARRQAGEAGPADGQLHRQLRAAILADGPDAQKLAGLQRQIVEAQAARLAAQIEVEQQVARVLTAEQRATLRERLEKVPEGGRRGPGRRRPAPAQ